MIFITKYLHNLIVILYLLFSILNILTVLYIINQNNYFIGYSRETPLNNLTFYLYFLCVFFIIKIIFLFINEKIIKSNIFLYLFKLSMFFISFFLLLGTGFFFYKIHLLNVGKLESITLGFTGLKIFRIYSHDELIRLGASFFESYSKETLCHKLGLDIDWLPFDKSISKDVFFLFETPKEAYNYIKNVIDALDKETFFKHFGVVEKEAPSTYSTHDIVFYSLLAIVLSTTFLYGVSYYLGYSGFFGFFTWNKKVNKSETLSKKSLEKDNKSETESDTLLEKIISDNKKIIEDNKKHIEDNDALKVFLNSFKDKPFVTYDDFKTFMDKFYKHIKKTIKAEHKDIKEPNMSLIYKELKKINNNNIDKALKDLYE